MPLRYKRAVKAKEHSAPHRRDASLDSEVQEIKQTLTRLEHNLAEERGEFARQNAIVANRANARYILGSTVIGIGLFFIWGGFPSFGGRLSLPITLGQTIGAMLCLVGLMVLLRAYGDWPSLLRMRPHSRRHKGHRLLFFGLVLLLLLAVASVGWAALAVAAPWFGWDWELPKELNRPWPGFLSRLF